MSYISDLLAQTVAPRVQTELQPHLRGFLGGLIQHDLPQVWWFSTNSGTATLYVDQSGVARSIDGQSGSPDVSVSWTDPDAYASLTATNPSQVPAGTSLLSVEIHTSKGRAAYDQLRQRLGL